MWHTRPCALKLFLIGPSHSLDSELPEVMNHIIFAHHIIPRTYSDQKRKEAQYIWGEGGGE